MVRAAARSSSDPGVWLCEAAALLASKFADIAREGVEAHGGEVIELRGDEAVAVFTSAREVVRSAVTASRGRSGRAS